MPVKTKPLNRDLNLKNRGNKKMFKKYAPIIKPVVAHEVQGNEIKGSKVHGESTIMVDGNREAFSHNKDVVKGDFIVANEQGMFHYSREEFLNTFQEGFETKIETVHSPNPSIIYQTANTPNGKVLLVFCDNPGGLKLQSQIQL